MEASNLMDEGLNLMLFGMGFVFIFLTLLVFVTKFMSWIIIRYEKNVGVIPDEGVPSPTTYIPHHGPIADHVDSAPTDQTLISVLTAAVHKFRSRSKS